MTLKLLMEIKKQNKLTESEQATPVDSIKDLVRSSVKLPEFDKNT